MAQHTFVIAECGSCHDNSFTKALRLIDAAKECGADAAKFQYWSHPGKLAARRKLGPDAKAVYEKYQLPVSWLPHLKEHCDEAGIEFMCTAYLIEDIETVAQYVKRFKVSAYEARWPEFLLAHIGHSQPMIVSVRDHGEPIAVRTSDKLLHCVSEYPTPIDNLGLRSGFRESNCVDGLSDHTTSTLTGALAVAAGASIVEKHIRLCDTSSDNPDRPHAMLAYCNSRDMQGDWGCEGHEDCFEQYVRMIREAERAM